MRKGYQALCNFINGKSVSLIGAGVSNVPLVAYLYECGAKSVTVRDLKKTESDPEILTVLENGGAVVLGENYLENMEDDVIIRSPGIRPDLPQFLKAVEHGSYLTCETELFLQFVSCKTVAITGSDGKTTTTTLTAKMLEQNGYRVFLGGNIGKSMLPQLKEINERNCISVMELSSFQLMNCRFSPDICVITNLSENHLDWHRGMDEYLDAKKNILNHQNSTGRAVLNLDNEHTAVCKTNGTCCYFTYSPECAKQVNESVFCDGSKIYYRKDGCEQFILSTEDIILPGKHNVENFMAAIAAVKELVDAEDILQIAKTFGGVEHRIELCRILDGVKYYNSSIDSSPSRSTACLHAFQKKIIMIAGGYDKNLDYTALGDEICKHVKVLILCGATSAKIKKAVLGSELYSSEAIKIIESPDFDSTAKIAKDNATHGDIVVLSPASASFDEFSGYEERGDRFVEFVRAIQMENERESQEKAGDVCVEADSLETRECVKPSYESENRLGELE